MNAERHAAAERRSPVVFWVLLLVMLAAAAILYVKTTPKGVGLVSDSVNYINGARSIAQGTGYYRESGGGTLKPITNFPPFYSMLLSLPMLFGADGMRTAWALGLVFYVLNLLLIALLTARVSGRPWIGLAGALLFLASKPFLYYQVFAMSEGVFFFCTLAAFYLLTFGLEKDAPILWVLCGVFCGTAFLTRYVGIVSLGAVVAVILLLAPKSVRRWRAIGSVLLGGVPIVAAWLIRNQLASGNISNREAGVHPLTTADFRTGVMLFWRWVYPERYKRVESPVDWMQAAVLGMGILGLIFLVVLLIRGMRKPAEVDDGVRSVWTWVLYIFAYILVVYVTISFLDASVNIEERILYPCFMLLLLIFLTGIGWVARLRNKLALAGGLIAFCFLLFSFSQELIGFVPRFGQDGYGWAWDGWKNSPAMNVIRRLPPETVIYSNQPEAVSLWAGRGAFALLDPIDPSSGLERPGYAETMARIRGQVLDGESVLVFFAVESWVEPEEENWVTQLCDGLPVIYQDTSEWVLGKKELDQ